MAYYFPLFVSCGERLSKHLQKPQITQLSLIDTRTLFVSNIDKTKRPKQQQHQILHNVEWLNLSCFWHCHHKTGFNDNNYVAKMMQMYPVGVNRTKMNLFKFFVGKLNDWNMAQVAASKWLNALNHPCILFNRRRQQWLTAENNKSISTDFFLPLMNAERILLILLTFNLIRTLMECSRTNLLMLIKVFLL